MPEIIRLTNCKICVYAGDHQPPHFHVRGPGWRVSIEIASCRVLKGKGPRTDINEAIAWALNPENLSQLAAEWRRLNERE
jgi:hypothetical protein